MDSREFAKTIEKQVAGFCASLDAKLPAYSYIPLTTDEMRIKVMQSRLFNEVRAGEIFGGWLKSTPELDVKKTLAEATHEEYVHATYLGRGAPAKGGPHDYNLPAQMAMFNGLKASPTLLSASRRFPWRRRRADTHRQEFKGGYGPEMGNGALSKNSRRRRRARQLPV
jgi:hypothetical protein